MQTPRSLTACAGAACLALFASMPDARAVDLATAAACLDQHDRLKRLGCYDDALGYIPNIRPIGAAQATPTIPPKTARWRFLDTLFIDQTSLERMRLTVIDPTTSTTIAIAEDGSDAFAELLKSDPKENDIYLTIPGRETGEAAGAARLVLACEQEITQIVVLWDNLFRAGAATARLYTDDQSRDPLRTTLRVVENGYATRAPRGLEAIALLKEFRPHIRLQIAVDQDTSETRSALFNIDRLARNLRLLSRRCGWS